MLTRCAGKPSFLQLKDPNSNDHHFSTDKGNGRSDKPKSRYQSNQKKNAQSGTDAECLRKSVFCSSSAAKRY